MQDLGKALVKAGLATEEQIRDAQTVERQTENPQKTLKQAPLVARPKTQPRIVTCIKCGSPYEYFKRAIYPGKSPKRCPDCQPLPGSALQNLGGVGNSTRRPLGHKTRQQHKHVPPTKHRA